MWIVSRIIITGDSCEKGNLLKKEKLQEMHLRFINVISPHNNRRHVSTTHVVVFRIMLRTSIPIQIELQYVKITAHCNCVCILALTTQKMVTQVAERSGRLLCNRISFINPSAFIGLSINFLRLINVRNSTRSPFVTLLSRRSQSGR